MGHSQLSRIILMRRLRKWWLTLPGHIMRVPLANRGSLVIEQTEALVSIDVNGGHEMLDHGNSQEKAILEVNLAAAKQIARELRLRDIGGIIVVDFIDMADESNKRLVYEEAKKAVERDRSMVPNCQSMDLRK